MKIKIFPSGIYGAITYLIYDEISKEGAIIDCTWENFNLHRFFPLTF